MNSPLAWLAVFLSAGIWISNFIRVPVLFFIVAAVIFMAAAAITIKKKITFLIFLSLIFFSVGCLLYQAAQIFPAYHIKNYVSKEPQEVYLEGVVLTEPQLSRTYYGEPAAAFILGAQRLQTNGLKSEVRGKVKIKISGETKENQINYGDKILMKGILSVPHPAGNPGEFDYASYLGRNGVFCVLSAKGQNFAVLESGLGNAVARAAYKVRERVRSFIASNLPRDEADFLIAILLGLRQDLDVELNDVFMKTGTVHLLAISGLNVGLLVFLVMLILTVLRVPKKVNILLTICFLVFYAVLTNGTASVVRAAIMSIAILLGLLMGRQIFLWNSLGLAAVIILAFDPNAFFDIGFQLSFLSVISVIYLTPKLEALFGYDRKLAVPFMSRWKRYLLEGLIVSLAAWIGVLPFVLYYFNIVTPVSVVANLFAVPLSFLITAASMPFIIFGYFCDISAKVFGASTLFFCDLLFASNNVFSKIPLAYVYFPKPPLYFIAAYYAFLAAFMEREKLKVPAAKIAIAGLFLVNVIVWPVALKPDSGKLEATFLDVGHGDSIFLEFPRGGNMLIDGGSGGDWDEGRRVVLPFLRNKGVQVIDAILLTHPDSDHVGGLVSVMGGVRVKEIFYNGAEYRTGAYRDFKDIAVRSNIKRRILKAGDSIEGIKEVGLFCLNPGPGLPDEKDAAGNDKSLVMKVRYKDSGMLFCGDIGEKPVSRLVFLPQPLLKAQLLMLPHHGGGLTPAKEAFIESVSPLCVVISQGKLASEVSRTNKAEETLLSKGIKVFRTDEDGAIFASTDGTALFVRTFISSR